MNFDLDASYNKIVAKNETDAEIIRNRLREDYKFYIRAQRVLTKNKRPLKLLWLVQDFIELTTYQYEHITIPPTTI